MLRIPPYYILKSLSNSYKLHSFLSIIVIVIMKSISKWAVTFNEASQSISILIDIAWSQMKD